VQNLPPGIKPVEANDNRKAGNYDHRHDDARKEKRLLEMGGVHATDNAPAL